jgi:hypothetical protein
MLVSISARVAHRRHGFAAYAPAFSLSGHGVSREEAVASLKQAVIAWCRALHAMHGLEPALARAGVPWEETHSTLTVEVNESLTGEADDGRQAQT